MHNLFYVVTNCKNYQVIIQDLTDSDFLFGKSEIFVQ